jgi:AraC-like DNA-binding protein
MMAGTQYKRRLQRALDYIENHLESRICLEDLAAEACYSPSHFVWMFRAATGRTPMEYVRQRRMTEAARAILSGDDIVDAVYRFGFSAQDAFTRSFRRTIGSPPGRLRQSGGTNGTYTPALNLQQEGGGKMLNYHLDCDPLESILRIEQLLTDEVRELVAKIATETMDVRAVDPNICEELSQARVICVDNGTVRIDTSVFLEDDLVKIHGVADRWGEELAQRIAALDASLPEMSPGCRRLLIGMNGIDQGVFDLLISEGYAFNHRATSGRYAGAKIDFYELCDAYDRFGPYLSGGYGCSGERFAVKIIGHDQGIYRYLTAGISQQDDELYMFRTNANKYLTDALGELLLGEAYHPSLSATAEAAGLIRAGKALIPVITTAEAPAYWSAVKLVRDVIREFSHSNAPEMKAFLKSTLPGKQGVSPDKLIVDLMRYVRMVSHKALYDSGFYTDSLPEGGNITVYRELTARIDGK